MTITLDNDAMATVWRIHGETMETIGAPAKRRSPFDAMLARLKQDEDFDIWTARAGGEVVAALLVVRFNGVSEYFASGTATG